MVGSRACPLRTSAIVPARPVFRLQTRALSNHRLIFPYQRNLSTMPSPYHHRPHHVSHPIRPCSPLPWHRILKSFCPAPPLPLPARQPQPRWEVCLGPPLQPLAREPTPQYAPCSLGWHNWYRGQLMDFVRGAKTAAMKSGRACHMQKVGYKCLRNQMRGSCTDCD